MSEGRIANASAALLLGERLTLLELCGAGLVLASILAAAWRRPTDHGDAESP